MKTETATLQGTLMELFPASIWRKEGELTFPEGKLRYNDEELSFFEQILKKKKKEVLNRIEILDDRTGEEIFKAYQTESSGDTSRVLLGNRDQKYLEDINKALIKIKTKTYGKNGIGVVHPYRLFLVPTTTKNCIHNKKE